MGLKQVRFIDWFQGKFPAAVRTVPNHEGANFDSVFIDLNCILHPVMRSAHNESMFVKKLFTTLDRLLSQFIPGRICYLSVDGPAPMAKLLTQKARRLAKSGSKKHNGMSTLQVTPGCPFMYRLEQYLSYYTVRYLQQRRSQGISPDLKFVIDHSNNPGEGESKIIENIVQQASNIRGRPCAIISMDSDAVLQAIALGMPNIYVVRKDSPFQPSVVVIIDRFMSLLEQLFPAQSNRVRLDFCALCLFRGNDYLRGLAVNLERLWNAYVYTKYLDPKILLERGELRFLIDAEFRTFDLVFLEQLILNSYKHPSTLELPSNIEQHSYQPHTPQHQQEPLQHQRQPGCRDGTCSNIDTYGEYENKSDMESEDEDNDSSAENDSDSDDGDAVVEDEDAHRDQDINDTKTFVVKKYLEGVLWNLEMYCTGSCPDVSYSYGYQAAPPRRAIREYVASIAQTKGNHAMLPRTTCKILMAPTTNKSYPHPLVCSLILLPATSGSLYLHGSLALVHTSIIPSEVTHLTYGEIEAIDAKVQSHIDILGASEKDNDKMVAKELLELYATRPPYIWTRTRFVGPRARPCVLPQSPSIIIDQLANPTVVSGDTKTESRAARFLDLEMQPDIIRNVVRAPPNLVSSHPPSGSRFQPGNPSGVPTHTIEWASAARQQMITQEATKPLKRWPFYFVRGKNRFGPPSSFVGQQRQGSQKPKMGQKQESQKPEAEQQQNPQKPKARQREQGGKRAKDKDTIKPLAVARRDPVDASQSSLEVDVAGPRHDGTTTLIPSKPAPTTSDRQTRRREKSNHRQKKAVSDADNTAVVALATQIARTTLEE
ncbi:hypothetical protein BGZ51_000408 [Haplosporangium sp. Z 767]|nr:hypothetical protein BGZ51_000408 [Haplosporangium sp. Z 767]